MKLVIYPPVEAQRLEKIQAAAGAMQVVNADSEKSAADAMPDADAFFGKMTPRLLQNAHQLRWVQSPTASLEHYLFPELVEHPCTLTNMRGLYSDVIADHVFGYILCFARNLLVYLRQQQRRQWLPVGGEAERSTFAAGPAHVSAIDRAHRHLPDCTLGVVGLGHIGREVANRGEAFGMKVVACDPAVGDPPAPVSSLWPPDQLHQLLACSDFVVICAPHTPQTEGWFDREQFRQMKRDAYLINIGRGAIVKLDSLVSALKEKEIAGAALDVFEIEPLPTDHPLWDFENVIITPHIAAASVHIARRHLQTLLDNIVRFVEGRSLNNVVDKRLWF